jgi:predicted ATPase
MSAGTLVGRGVELAALEALVSGALDGRGGLALVTGIAGIGETACLAAAAEHAVVRGCSLGWGTCWDGGGAPPFWPWMQAFRELGQAAASGEEPAILRGHERGETVPTDRFELFDSSMSWLAAVSQTRPAVVVLDDVQWADVPSAVLLEFIAERVRRSSYELAVSLTKLSQHAIVVWLSLTVRTRCRARRRVRCGRPSPSGGGGRCAS